MSEHTRTPWRVAEDGMIVNGVDEDEYGICDCDPETYYFKLGEQQANAKHIVHCVNNHERLTQALRQSGCPNAKSSESFGILSVSECCELFQTCDCGNFEVLAGLDAKL